MSEDGTSDARIKERRPDASADSSLLKEEARCWWCLEARVRALRQRSFGGMLHLPASARTTRRALYPPRSTRALALAEQAISQVHWCIVSGDAAVFMVLALQRPPPPSPRRVARRSPPARGFTTQQLTVTRLAGAEPLPVPLDTGLCKNAASGQLKKRSRRLSYSIAIPSDCSMEVSFTYNSHCLNVEPVAPQHCKLSEQALRSLTAAWQYVQPQCENMTPTTAARPSPTPSEDELTAAGMTDGGAIRVRKLSYVEPVRQQT